MIEIAIYQTEVGGYGLSQQTRLYSRVPWPATVSRKCRSIEKKKLRNVRSCHPYPSFTLNVMVRVTPHSCFTFQDTYWDKVHTPSS